MIPNSYIDDQIEELVDEYKIRRLEGEKAEIAEEIYRAYPEKAGHIQAKILKWEATMEARGMWHALKQSQKRPNPPYRIEQREKVEAAYHKGIQCASTGNFREAIKKFEEAITQDSTHAPSHFALGEIYRKQRRFDKAYDAYRECLRYDPTEKSAYYHLGMICLRQRRSGEHMYEQAIRCFTSNANRRNLSSLIGLSLVYFFQREWDKSLHWLRRARLLYLYSNKHKSNGAKDREPILGRIYLCMGIVFLGKGEGQMAVVWLKRAKFVDPSNRIASVAPFAEEVLKYAMKIASGIGHISNSLSGVIDTITGHVNDQWGNRIIDLLTTDSPDFVTDRIFTGDPAATGTATARG